MITLFATETCPNCEIIKKQLDKTNFGIKELNTKKVMI